MDKVGLRGTRTRSASLFCPQGGTALQVGSQRVLELELSSFAALAIRRSSCHFQDTRLISQSQTIRAAGTDVTMETVTVNALAGIAA